MIWKNLFVFVLYFFYWYFLFSSLKTHYPHPNRGWHSGLNKFFQRYCLFPFFLMLYCVRTCSPAQVPENTGKFPTKNGTSFFVVFCLVFRLEANWLQIYTGRDAFHVNERNIFAYLPTIWAPFLSFLFYMKSFICRSNYLFIFFYTEFRFCTGWFFFYESHHPNRINKKTRHQDFKLLCKSLMPVL